MTTKKPRATMAAFAAPTPPPPPAPTNTPAPETNAAARKSLAFRMTDDQWRTMKITAMHEGMTIQRLLERMADEYLERRGQKPAFKE